MRSPRRVILCLAATLTLAGCATGVSGTADPSTLLPTSPSLDGSSVPSLSISAAATTSAAPSSPATMTSVAPTSSASAVASRTVSRAPTAAAAPKPAATTPKPAATHAMAAAPKPAAPSSGTIPAIIAAHHYSTGDATQIITVSAPSSSSQTATLSAWTKVGTGWQKAAGLSAIPAWVGTQGVGAASESSERTPAGSFTLTQAFGAGSKPATKLPYVKTDLDDWWVSQVGNKYYNQHRHCAGSSTTCGFDTTGEGSCAQTSNVNEHLYCETPFYNYAVVIDYNTTNAPGGVRQGAGSAFFLHVHPDGTGGTAGCVSLGQATLLKLMAWLDPARHPRIVIGVL